MTVIETADDSLSLELVKSHVLVQHNEDDLILTHYIDAALMSVEGYCHTHFLKRTWEATDEELSIIDGIIYLMLPVNPKSITLTFDSVEYELNHFQWYYVSGLVKVPVLELGINGTLENVIAVTGEDPIISLVNQARLLLIGSWYATREDDILGITSNELPSGAIKFLMPLVMDAAL